MSKLDDNNEKDPIEAAEDKIVDEYIKEFYSEIKHLKGVKFYDDEIELPF